MTAKKHIICYCKNCVEETKRHILILQKMISSLEWTLSILVKDKQIEGQIKVLKKIKKKLSTTLTAKKVL